MEDQNIKMRILYAAKELFAEQGFDGTSIRQICEKANANVSLISYYFGGKDNVFQSIFETFFSGTQLNLNQMDQDFSDPLKGIQFLVDQIISFSFEDTQLSYIINQELLMESSRCDIVLSYVQPVWVKIDELLQRGKEQGVFQFDSLAHTSLIIRGICLSYKNYYKLQTVTEDQESMEKIKQSAVQFILNGLNVRTGAVI